MWLELYSFEPGLMIPKTCSTPECKIGYHNKKMNLWAKLNYWCQSIIKTWASKGSNVLEIIFVRVISKPFPRAHILMSVKLAMKCRQLSKDQWWQQYLNRRSMSSDDLHKKYCNGCSSFKLLTQNVGSGFAIAEAACGSTGGEVDAVGRQVRLGQC